MNPDPDNMPEPELPPKLAGALRSLNRQKLVVPSSIDTAIAKAAKDHLQRSVGRAKASAEPPVAFSDDETATLATPQPSGDAGETPIKFIRPPAARPEHSD